MYVPKRYEIKDWPEIERFIRENPLATLVSRGEEYAVATHVPLELETNERGESILTGHVARPNQHAGLFASQPNILAIFQSPAQHYISSSWYAHPNVPTWNYMSVHVYGRIQTVDGERLRTSLEKMTHTHERVSAHPLSRKDLEDQIDKQLAGIIGFEIEIVRLEAAYKMSQNRDDRDYVNIIRELEKLEDHNARIVAKKMAELRKVH
ncbi:MAG TPA: FMN-binding negative transcriptional regulator [Bacteroidota bacterium]|nr:FMN-binding negative transcriptional regulator [Bacteroidota bacterium]